MSKTVFAQTIINKLSATIGTDGGSYNDGSASSAMVAVANAITEYLIANTQVTISYTGVIPGVPSVPDPIITDNFSIVGVCAPTGPSNSFDTWIKQIEANIIAGFQLAPIGKAGVMFVQKPFLSPGIIITQSQLTNAHDVGDKNPQLKIWEMVCGAIMDWVNNLAINPTSGAASRPTAPSTGTASITKIALT